MVTGRLFHNDGPATEKARRPYRSRLYPVLSKNGEPRVSVSEWVHNYGVTSDVRLAGPRWS